MLINEPIEKQGIVMCGILGVIGCRDVNAFKGALHTIAHRGPDDEGVFQHQEVMFGHRRLSIQDISNNAHQPMHSEDGRYVIIFNGEIYNHKELRKNLKNKYTFKSTGDTETLLYGYVEYGTDILAKLNGIFAFAIYDIENQEIFIARDQLGVKPLYYYLSGDTFLFGSEIKSFLKFPFFNSGIRNESLFYYTNLLWSPGEYTPFTKVKKLLPGHFIKVKPSELSTNFTPTKYYEIPFTGDYFEKDEKELIDQLDLLLNKAVKAQLLSDVPVGFFLSGGLDSSLLVAIAKKHTTQSLQTFTIKSSDISSEGFTDDLHYAKIVAQHLNVDLEIVDAEVDIVKDFDKMIWHLDEPQADAAPLNVSNICSRAKEMGYKVLIGGAGGDDLFSGYRRHQTLKINDLIDYIPRPLRVLANSIVKKLNPTNNTLRRITKGLKNIEKSKIERLAGYFSWLDVNKNKKLFIDKNSRNWKEPSQYLIELLENIPEEKSNLNKMLYWELNTFLVDHNLNYTDKMSMMHGVEVRVPYLDLELVEFSAKLPPKLKMRGKTTKYLLKKVAERYLPREVIYRPKTGFGAPVRKWITQDMDDLISNYLSKDQLSQRGIFDPEEVWKLINDNKKGKIDASYSIWSLLAIESWFRQFVDVN